MQGLQDSVQDDGALLHKGVETHKGGLGLKLNLMLHPCIQQYTREYKEPFLIQIQDFANNFLRL